MRPHQQDSKYDFRVNPVYQVDFQNSASGKRVSATKRRVRFRFGYSNKAAIEAGHSGNACRGEEHEVSLVWSLTSGKRLVVADGEEVHFSMGKRTDTKFETSWTVSGGHIVKLIAHAAPPLFAVPGFRQFDLLLDGCSFFDMPKIYELGAGSMKNRLPSTPMTAPPTPTYEERSYYGRSDSPQERSFASLPPAVSPNMSPPQRAESMPAMPATPTDVLSAAAPVPAGYDHLSTPAPQQPAYQPLPAPVPPQPVQLTPMQQPQQYHTPVQHHPQATPVQHGQVDEFAPVAPPPPTFQDVSNQILSNYAPDPSIPALTSTPHYADHHYQSASPTAVNADLNEESKPVTPESEGPITLKPTMAPISIAEMEARDEKPMSDLEKAFKAIVNLDDIDHTLETPEEAKFKRKQESSKPYVSKPKPPTTPEWHLGSKPSLKDVKEHAPVKAPAKEIMRTHAFDPAAAQAGMMVVYGSTPGLPAAQGFGAGVHQSHYGAYAAAHPPYYQQAPPPPQQMYAAY